jgi:hypothetical protein
MTPTAHGEAALQLRPRARVAFACGCAEHVVPLFERLFVGRPVREAVDGAWTAVLGSPLSTVQLAVLTNGVSAVVPNISRDRTLQAELAMNIADLTLDVLKCAAGDDNLCARVGIGVLDALTVAIDALKGEDPGEWREDQKRPSGPHRVLLDEWNRQSEMLNELAEWRDERTVLTWREEHRRRGRALAESLCNG